MGRFLDDLISGIEKAVMLAAYLTIILVVGLETIRRMITGEQAAWGPEIAMGAFVWLSWFAMASGVRTGAHLSFTTLRDRMGPRLRQGMEVFDCLLWFALGLIVIAVSWDVVELNERFNQKIFGTDIPMAAISIAVPLGWAFTMMRVAQQLVRVLRGETGPHVTAEDIR
ncbi:MAG: TRAP transporter small permease subunit [Alphaproteobacteria bacterium]|nr:TRAP transporter small permease subunit [Alphaproteobacteria bacterium]MCB9931405.1 TRAP transporter small permease subunit [Alphaproteobacteria bacterium]